MFPAFAPSPRHLWTWLVRALAAVAATLIAGWVARAFPAPSAFTSLFDPSIGIALLLLLRWGTRMVPAIAAAAVASGFADGSAWEIAAPLGVGHAIGPWVGALWLTRGRDRAQRGAAWPDPLRLTLVGVFGCAVIDAAAGTAWLAVVGATDAADMPLAALHHWMGGALGILMVAAPVASWRHDPRSDPQTLRPATAALLSAAVLASGWALALPPRWAFAAAALLALAPLLLAPLAWRLAGNAASAGALAITVGLLAATDAGKGPFVRLAPEGGLLLLWVWAAATGSVVLAGRILASRLRRPAQRWQIALDSTEFGVADWNLASDAGFSSERWRLLMDDPRGEHSARFERWLGLVHPDDRQALRAVLAHRNSGDEGPHRHEVRIMADRRRRRLAVRLVVAERGAQGQPLRIVASAEDVTERHCAEQARELSSSLFMNLREGLLVTDEDLRAIDANPSWLRITGVARDDLIGRVPELLRPQATDPITRAQQASLWAAVRTSGSWSGEIADRQPDGSARVLQLTVSTVHGTQGRLRYHLVTVSDITESRIQRDRLERQASFDELTRLPNRGQLGRMLADAMAAADRGGSLLAVCDLDIDRFKAVNERFGSAAGDALLTEIANRLRGALRHRSGSASDAVLRLGGDEFALLLHVSSIDDARAAVERLLHTVAAPVALDDGAGPVTVTASVGATVYPMDASDADTLLRHADHAMYGVKQSGRNGWLFFDPEYSRRTEERVLAIGRVQDALDHHEFALYYQPKVDLRRGTVLGVEALLRWNHPEHGLVPPAQFLPLIEHTGLSARIGDHVLASALEQLEAWQDEGLDLTVSVNISARHLQEPDFAQRLGELLARHRRPLGPRVELEVLETAALADIDFSCTVLDACARQGVRWALDDFGTGYSTFTYLKRLPVQILKIDRSFVRQMLDDAQDRAIVEGVIKLAGTFGCVAVAEGVESPAQGRMLLEMGCEVGQGTGIAPPMPAARVAAWVREWRGLFALAPAPLPAASEDHADEASSPARGAAAE